VKISLVVAVLLGCATLAHAAAEKLDPRLATVRKAFVVPIDDLTEDRPVALCFAEHLTQLTPIESVPSADQADVVFRVKANLPSAGMRR
jgi:hypothetical protein